MKTNLCRKTAGFTLVELMISAACLSMIMGMLVTGVSALQRGFRASHDFSQSHAEQVRVCDYLQRDCRAATDVQVLENGTRVTLKIPTTNPGLLSLNLPASVAGLLGALSTPTPTKTVHYKFLNRRITRTEGSQVKTIASHLHSFTAEQLGVQLRTTITFLSSYGARTRTTTELPSTRAVALIGLRAMVGQ